MRDIVFVYENKDGFLGGVQSNILVIAEALLERDMLRPILLTADPGSRFGEAFRGLGGRVYGARISDRGGLRRGRDALLDIAGRHDVALVEGDMFRESMVARLFRRQRPDVPHVFRVHTHLDGRIPDWGRRTLHRTLDRLTRRRVSVFVPISNIVADELHFKSGAPRDKIHVVRNGVVAPGDADLSTGGRAPLPPAVAVVGDLMERKQQLAAVKAVGALHARGIDVDLHIVGDDRENVLPAIDAAAQDMAIEQLLHVHGYLDRERLGRVLANVSIVALPSLFEGTPTSIIEGMAMRKVVVTTPVGGTPEFLEDGVNGFLHAPGDAAALAAILERVLTGPASCWDALRDRAHQTWRDLFSLDAMVDGLQAVYRQIGVI